MARPYLFEGDAASAIDTRNAQDYHRYTMLRSPLKKGAFCIESPLPSRCEWIRWTIFGNYSDPCFSIYCGCADENQFPWSVRVAHGCTKVSDARITGAPSGWR